MTQGTGGGAEEVLFTLTADVTGVLDALTSITDGMVAVDVGLNELAAAFAKLDTSQLTFGDLKTLLSAVEQGLQDAGISAQDFYTELGRTRDELLSTSEAFIVAVPVVDELGNVIKTLALFYDDLGQVIIKGSLALDGFGKSSLTTAQAQEKLIASFALEEAAMVGLEDAMGVYQTLALGGSESTLAVAEGQRQAALAVWATEEAFAAIDEKMGKYLDSTLQVDGALRTLSDMSTSVSTAQDGLASSTERVAQLEFDFGTTLKGTVVPAVQQVVDAIDGPLNQALAELDPRTQAVRDQVEQLSIGFEQGRITLQQFTDAGLAQEQVLAELARLYISTAMSEQQMADAGVSMGAINAVIDNVASGMNLLQASVKATADGFSVLGDAASLSLGSLRAVFETLGASVGDATAKMNELAVAQANVASSASLLTKAEQENQVALLTGINTQLTAVDGYATVRYGTDALSKSLYGEGDAALTAGADTALAGTQMQDAGLKADGAAASFHISGYMLLFLGQMALQMGMQFLAAGENVDHSLGLIQTMLGASDQEIQGYKDSITKLGDVWGVTSGVAVAALLTIVQAQFRGTDATNILSDAMRLQYYTGSTLTQSTDLLTQSLRAYGASAQESGTYADALYQGFRTGRQSLEEMQSILGPVIGDAAALGINIHDLVNTEALFTQSTSDSSRAVREFQAFIAGLNTFTSLTSDQLTKMAGAFDLTKYAAMDFTAKLADLAKFSDGNVQEFTKLIGGTTNAKNAIDDLDISTKQLAKNAAALGVSFDPVVYNSDTAAQKLLYLMGIVDYSPAKFAKLTDGVKGTNLALADLGPALDKAGQMAFDMSAKFDMTQFKTEDLSQKLHQLADFFGGPYTKGFLTAIGGANNLKLALDILAQEPDQTHTVTVKGDTTDVHSKLVAVQDHLKLMEQKHIIPVDIVVPTKPLTDAQTATNNLSAAWSHLSDSFMTTFGPQITEVLRNITININTLAHPPDFSVIPRNFVQFGLMPMITDVTQYGGELGREFAVLFGVTIPVAIQQGAGTIQRDIQGIMTGGQLSITQGIAGWLASFNTFISQAIQKFTGLKFTLVGGSIIPDMVHAITASLVGGGASWTSVMSGAITSIIGVFNSLPGRAAGIFNTAVNTILGILNGAASSLYNSGVGMINSLASGIAAGMGAAITAAWNVANAVAAILAHHSPPKTGPMHDDDTWMPNMMAMFTHGITDNAGPLQAAALHLASTISVPLTGQVQVGTASTGGSGTDAIVAVLWQIYQVLRTQQTHNTMGSSTMQGGQQSMFGGGQSGGALDSMHLRSLYLALNRYGGISYESGSRGAFAGLGV